MDILRNLRFKFIQRSSDDYRDDSFLVTTAENRAFNAIPEKIFGYLEVTDLFKCRLVHTSWNNILDTPTYWLNVLQRKGMSLDDINIWKVFLEDAKEDDGVRKEIKLCLMKLAFHDLKVTVSFKIKTLSFFPSKKKISTKPIYAKTIPANPINIAKISRNVVLMNALMKYPKSRQIGLAFLESFKFTNSPSLHGLDFERVRVAYSFLLNYILCLLFEADHVVLAPIIADLKEEIEPHTCTLCHAQVGFEKVEFYIMLQHILIDALIDKKHRGDDTVRVITPIITKIKKERKICSLCQSHA